jgi:hypothetical protein
MSFRRGDRRCQASFNQKSTLALDKQRKLRSISSPAVLLEANAVLLTESSEQIALRVRKSIPSRN